jgi:hypothetical protein
VVSGESTARVRLSANDDSISFQAIGTVGIVKKIEYYRLFAKIKMTQARKLERL